MELISLVISALALFFSVVSFVLTQRQRRELEVTRQRLDNAIFDINRDAVFEGRLAEWPAAFKFHGVNLRAAKREGLSPQQIAYIVLSVNALVSFCGANNIIVHEKLTQSDYRQRMFAQPVSRRAWGYARLCFTRAVAEQIDKYLLETYGDKYPSL